MQAIRILLASPSPVTRSRLARSLAAEPEVQVLGQASDLSQSFTLCESLEPDLVLVAEEFCDLADFDGMRSLFRAVNARHLRVLDGPGPASATGARPTGAEADPWISAAMPQAEMMARIRAQMSAPRQASRPVLRTLGAAPSALSAGRAGGPDQRPLGQASGEGRQKLVVIGASTGGIDALLTILSAYPADCPPTAIVQHTGQGFSDSLIRLFARNCAAEVLAAQDHVTLGQGQVCIAGGSKGHLRLRPAVSPTPGQGANPGAALTCGLSPGAPVSGHMPSVDELFRSAVPLAPHVVGVLLTGMGQDGAAGLLELRRAGCLTIGQDARTSTVYGMPKVAWDMGAVQTQLPLDKIAAEILRCAWRGPAQQMIAQ